jgi:ribosomal protein L2
MGTAGGQLARSAGALLDVVAKGEIFAGPLQVESAAYAGYTHELQADGG